MDSMDLEKEKGITIRSKNTSVHWGDHIINIVDTPGHADFGGEVERVMKMVDGVLLVVDAYDGPQAQTRFVLRKALQEDLKVILVINKIDRPHSEPAAMHDKVLELLIELDATDEQFDAPTFYGSARDGYFKANLADENVDMIPLLQGIWDHIPAPDVDPDGPFRMLASNIAWDDYVGRVAMGKVLSGKVAKGDNVFLYRKDGSKVRTKISRIFEYSALQTSSPKKPSPATSSASPASKTWTSARPSPTWKTMSPFPSWTSTRRPSPWSSASTTAPVPAKKANTSPAARSATA